MSIVRTPYVGKIGWAFVGALAIGACAEASDNDPIVLGEGSKVEAQKRPELTGARRGCATPDLSQAEMDAIEAQIAPALEALRAEQKGLDTLDGRHNGVAVHPAVVPTHVHIIRDGNGAGDIPDSMVQAQMDVLNDAFAGGISHPSASVTSIRFELVDIDRTNNAGWYHVTPGS